MRRTLAVPAAALLAALAAGCADGPERLVVPAVRPVADSPTRAVETLRWAYEHRAWGVYRTLFTDDFVFAFAPADSAGSAYRERPWVTEDELVSAANLLAGGSVTEEPASGITLVWEAPLVDLPDPRPGRDAAAHRLVDADFTLRVDRPSGVLEARGVARFFVTRGDSARVQPGLPAVATRWYVDRWEDLSFRSGVLPAALAPRSGGMPARTSSWGQVKSLYR